MKSLFLIGILFLLVSPAYGELIYPRIKVLIVPRCHMCHDPFIPRDHLVLVPEADLVRIEREGEFRIFIENTFRSPLQEVKLLVKSPAFDIWVKPPLLERLMPGERTFFFIRLKLREGFKPGDYPLRISVEARDAVLRPTIETMEVVAEEVITEPPVQPVPLVPPGVEAIIPEVEPEVEPLPQEMVEPQVEEAGEIVVRVEEFILAKRWYLYLIPILLLVGLLIWRKLRQK